MANKSRILNLLRYLQETSDEDHPVTTAEIRKALAEKGCPVTVETLRNDIAMLQETGFDISVNEASGLSTTYSYLDRPLDVPELQILIDAVSSSQFLTREKSRQLIDKLVAMAGPSHREELQPGIMVSEHVKASNEQLLYIVQAIRESIRARRKIAFQYFRYDMSKHRVPRLNGKIYEVSPYATIWKNDRYFLVGYSQERQRVAVFRIDRMGMPKQLDKPCAPEPDTFRISNYTDKIFNMYDDGIEETVTLRCRRHMIDTLVDWFGKDVEPENITENTFDAKVKVSLSPSFYAWVLSFAGDMTIAGPPEVCDEYRRLLQQGINEVQLSSFPLTQKKQKEQ